MSYRSLKNEKGVSDAYASFLQYNEKEKRFVLDDFSGGVCGETAASVPHTVASLCNMQADGKALCSVSLPREEAYAFCDGMITDEAYADGVWLFRKGRSLYAWKEGKFSVIGVENMMEETYGAIYYADGAFLVLDGGRILRVEQELAYLLLTQEPTVWYIAVSSNGESYMENKQPNPFCRYLDYVLADVNMETHTIPAHLAVDASFIEVRTSGGSVLPNTRYTFDGKKITFDSDLDTAEYRVRLKLAETSDDENKISFASLKPQRDLFAKAKKMQTTSLPSHRFVYLFTEPKEKKKIKALLLSSAWDFCCLSEDRVLSYDAGERVSALVSYEEGFLVFSEGAVKKLFLSEDTAVERIDFSTKSFKNDFGSDMAGSICSFDDKIVFANSKSGVYYINKYGITERDVSRRISANIEGGENGFFSHTAEEFANATSVCAFGKYYLTIGVQTYIWDYSARLPDSTQSVESEYEMLWSICEAAKPAQYFREIAKRLYYMEEEKDSLFYLIPDFAEGEAVSSSLTTAESDFHEQREKRLSGILLCYRAAGDVKLRISYDGVLSQAEYILPPTKDFSYIRIRPHAKRFYRLAITLSSEYAMGIWSIVFRYL